MKFDYPEGATPIDADELADLIPTHIKLQKELNEWEQKNISDATELYYNKQFTIEEILDFYFLLKVHKDMFDKTWKWAGKTRKTMKNIGADVSQIFEQTKYLCDDVKFWIENDTYSKDEIGARFHHRLVQIHLFPNGNGRHSRFVTDLLMKSVRNELFTWGNKDLYSQSSVRNNYITSLKEADKNNYKPLLDFVRT
ncbi:MAG TPA: mobile mystery protein B [Ignavibacteria bacterium]